MNLNRVIIFSIFTFLVLSQIQCYEHPEDCMDIRAVNYAVDADNPCEDCCKYPSLNLIVEHVYDTLVVDTMTAFLHNGQPLQIKSLNLYFSNFTLLNGTTFDSASIRETLEILYDENDDDYERVVFPVAKINLGRSGNYELGSFKKADEFNKLTFDFGIKENINHATLDRIPTSNGLYQNIDSMYINKLEGFYFLKLELESDQGIIKEIRIKGDEYLQKLEFDHYYDFKDRSDKDIQITIRYEKWFENIDFFNDDESGIIEKLIKNLEGSIFQN